MSIAVRLRTVLGKIRHLPINSRNNKWANRMWLLIAAVSSCDAGSRLGFMLAFRQATTEMLFYLIVMTIIAAVSFTVLWLAQSPRILVKNCTFTNNDVGLKLTTGDEK